MPSPSPSPKPSSRRIHQNIWGNWNGYEGRHKVKEFGTDQHAANDWLLGKEEPQKPLQPIKLTKFTWND